MVATVPPKMVSGMIRPLQFDLAAGLMSEPAIVDIGHEQWELGWLDCWHVLFAWLLEDFANR